MANNLLDIIVLTGALSIPTFNEQLYAKNKTAAENQFNANLKAEVINQLKLNNFVFGSDGAFEEFAAARLTKVTIIDTNTSMICLDVVVDEQTQEITSYGTILVQWQGAGFEVIIQNPSITVKTF